MVLLGFYSKKIPPKNEARGGIQKWPGGRGAGKGGTGGEAPKRGIEGIGSDADVREWLQKHALAMVSCDSLPAAYFQEPVRESAAGAKK